MTSVDEQCWLDEHAGKAELCCAKNCSQLYYPTLDKKWKCYMNLVSVVSLEAKCPPR